MPAYLITGNPGSGKSTVARELSGRGFLALDADDDAQLSHWEDGAGNRVDGPPTPDKHWLDAHSWVWSRRRMREMLSGTADRIFICGIARNQDQLFDLFDRAFLLRIGAATQEDRLAAYDAANPPGRSEAGRQEIRAGLALFEAQMLKLGAIALDGSRPAALIADDLLELVRAC